MKPAVRSSLLVAAVVLAAVLAQPAVSYLGYQAGFWSGAN